MKLCRAIATIGCCLLMVACGEESAIQSAIKSNLKDPESAKFDKLAMSADKQRACVVWNAKNSMGGYGNWAIAKLMKVDSKWEITSMDGGQTFECIESGFKALDAEYAAKIVAKEKGIAILQRARNVTHDAAVELAAGECSVVYQLYIEAFGKAAKHPNLNSDIDPNRKSFADTFLARVQADLEKGKCKI
jgi:hypothetical protein